MKVIWLSQRIRNRDKTSRTLERKNGKQQEGWIVKRVRLSYWILALLVVVAISGCATTESENLSARPWDSPKSWENGLPSGMTEGR
jgi:hypothetical protein